MATFNPIITQKSVEIFDFYGEILEYIVDEIISTPAEKELGDDEYEIQGFVVAELGDYLLNIDLRKVEAFDVTPATYDNPAESRLIGRAIYDLNATLWNESGAQVGFTYRTAKQEYTEEDFLYKIEELCTK